MAILCLTDYASNTWPHSPSTCDGLNLVWRQVSKRKGQGMVSCYAFVEEVLPELPLLEVRMYRYRYRLVTLAHSNYSRP